MTTLTQQSFTLPAVHDAPAELEETRTSDGRRPTLGRKLELTWEGLRASGVAGCPLCGGRMERRAAHARCGCCGTRLS
jgi:hypothetical protein